MSAPSPSMRGLARRLLAASRASSSRSGERREDGPGAHEAAVLCETLRVSVVGFAGPDGFGALLRRALALAAADVPALRAVRLGANGQLEGIESVAVGEEGSEAVVALAAHLLTLLETFIGETLTLRLIREGWPDAELGGQRSEEGD